MKKQDIEKYLKNREASGKNIGTPGSERREKIVKVLEKSSLWISDFGLFVIAKK